MSANNKKRISDYNSCSLTVFAWFLTVMMDKLSQRVLVLGFNSNNHFQFVNKSFPFSLRSVDPEGRVVRINYNNATRDSVLDLPLHQVQPFYRALKSYVKIMNRPENVVTYTMQPGKQTTLNIQNSEVWRVKFVVMLIKKNKGQRRKQPLWTEHKPKTSLLSARSYQRRECHL